MAKKTPRPPSQRLPRWIPLSLLSLLALITVIVVIVAVNASRVVVDNAGTSPTVVMPTPTPDPEPEPEIEEEPAPAFVSPAMQRLVAVGDDAGHIFRATVGGCPDPLGSLEVSFDGGESWEAGVIASVDARQIRQIISTGTDITRMVALGTDCTPQVSRSFVGGTSWEFDPDQSAAWFLSTSDARVVHTPVGDVALPCDAVGLSNAAERAIVLCSDSTVTTSVNSGRDWAAPVAAPNAIAAGTVAEGFTVVSAGEDDCAGVRTRLLTDGVLGEPGACVGLSDPTTVPAGVAGDSSGWYLWAGDAWLRSTDLGLNWGAAA